ncbi:hypothetical protein EDB84DRAFT_1226273, partial [Lactarius hengduanensis]
FHATSLLVCPDCSEPVRVGFGGEKNLAIHRTSKACQKKRLEKQNNKNKGPKRAPERPPRPNQPNHDLRAFFKPRVPLNPPTVVAPPLIHTDERSFKALEMGAPLQVEAGKTRKIPCQKGIELLSKLEAAATRIPNNVPLA